MKSFIPVDSIHKAVQFKGSADEVAIGLGLSTDDIELFKSDKGKLYITCSIPMVDKKTPLVITANLNDWIVINLVKQYKIVTSENFKSWYQEI